MLHNASIPTLRMACYSTVPAYQCAVRSPRPDSLHLWKDTIVYEIDTMRKVTHVQRRRRIGGIDIGRSARSYAFSGACMATRSLYARCLASSRDACVAGNAVRDVRPAAGTTNVAGRFILTLVLLRALGLHTCVAYDTVGHVAGAACVAHIACLGWVALICRKR